MPMRFQGWITKCNVLLYGLPNITLQILQRVKNYAARMIVRIGLGKNEHVTRA